MKKIVSTLLILISALLTFANSNLLPANCDLEGTCSPYNVYVLGQEINLQEGIMPREYHDFVAFQMEYARNEDWYTEDKEAKIPVDIKNPFTEAIAAQMLSGHDKDDEKLPFVGVNYFEDVPVAGVNPKTGEFEYSENVSGYFFHLLWVPFVYLGENLEEAGCVNPVMYVDPYGEAKPSAEDIDEINDDGGFQQGSQLKYDYTGEPGGSVININVTGGTATAYGGNSNSDSYSTSNAETGSSSAKVEGGGEREVSNTWKRYYGEKSSDNTSSNNSNQSSGWGSSVTVDDYCNGCHNQGNNQQQQQQPVINNYVDNGIPLNKKGTRPKASVADAFNATGNMMQGVAEFSEEIRGWTRFNDNDVNVFVDGNQNNPPVDDDWSFVNGRRSDNDFSMNNGRTSQPQQMRQQNRVSDTHDRYYGNRNQRAGNNDFTFQNGTSNQPQQMRQQNRAPSRQSVNRSSGNRNVSNTYDKYYNRR